MRQKGSKNLKTLYQEIEFEAMIMTEKLKMVKELGLDSSKELESFRLFFKKLCEILDYGIDFKN